MPRPTQKQQPPSDHVRAAAILDAQALDSVRQGLRWAAALASTLTEMGIASSDELTLICSITEGKCDAALGLLERAVVNPRAKTRTPQGPR
jgi:hypothetical protein